VDYYRVQAPSGATGQTVMQVMVWGVGSSQLLPRIHVYDADRRELNAEVLVNENGVVTLQVAGVTPGATYYVRVEGAVQDGPSATGNYFLGIDFTDRPVQLDTFARSQLDATTPEQVGQLAVHRSALFHFVLTAEQNNGTGVEMVITDAEGRVVAVLRAAEGQTASTTLSLAAGTYTFRFRGYRTDGQPPTPVRFTLRGQILTDPIGPQPEDTTEQPSQPASSTPPSSSSTSSGTTSSSSPPPDSYSWYSWYYYPPESTSAGPAPEDPYGSGYRG
jgi:hypothetical protein